MLLTGYVNDIKDIMLSKSIQDLKEAFDNFTRDNPESLTSQFTERRTKADAIRYQNERKSIQTPYYLTSRFWSSSQFPI